ncbi:MAG TPA: CBS domain-containing protein [Chloroflexota bacterium]|nr:CBS domain-containing protein [Chloroflexota bacterium]
MKAADIMRQPVFATTPWTPVQEVLAQLATNNVSGMPVVERDGTVIGIITEDDLLRAYIEGVQLELLTVQALMTTEPITVDVETPLADVMQIIHDEGILRVPVTEDGLLVGVISRSDVIRALAQPGQLGTLAFPIFHRHYQEAPAGERHVPERHLVPTYGW